MKKNKKICTNCLCMIGMGTRAKIIRQLREKPKNVSKIAECFCLTQPTISHHLKVLEKTGMILSKKEGREIYYYLNKKYPCKKCGIFELPFKT